MSEGTLVRISFPNGQWADLADPADVPERYARPVRARAADLSVAVKEVIQGAKAGDVDGDALTLAITSADVMVLSEVNDLTVCALVTAWSFGEFDRRPTLDQVLDLPKSAYDALQAAVAPHAPALMGVDFSPSPEPGSPT